jgi:hypothetical protein
MRRMVEGHASGGSARDNRRARHGRALPARPTARPQYAAAASDKANANAKVKGTAHIEGAGA